MKKAFTISSVLFGIVFLAGCGQQSVNQEQTATVPVEKKVTTDFTCGSQVKDSDGNIYGTLLVNKQCWMTSNMKVGIKLTAHAEPFTKPTNNGVIEKWCYRDSDDICASDGGLYSWDEAMQYSTTEGTQGICPFGWHIPTDAEQYSLEYYLKDDGQARDGTQNEPCCAPAGTKLQLGGASGLNFPIAGNYDGGTSNRLSFGGAWSSSQNGESALTLTLMSGYAKVFAIANPKTFGFSVRCLKD